MLPCKSSSARRRCDRRSFAHGMGHGGAFVCVCTRRPISVGLAYISTHARNAVRSQNIGSKPGQYLRQLNLWVAWQANLKMKDEELVSVHALVDNLQVQSIVKRVCVKGT